MLKYIISMVNKLTKNTPLVNLPSDFIDSRGRIQPVFHNHKGSVVVIETVPSVERANHYHKEDYHYCYIISGEIIYYERSANSIEIPSRFIFKKGEMFYTGPMVEHCMYFEVPTVFLTVGGKTRKQEEYEKDLVRVESLHSLYKKASESNAK